MAKTSFEYASDIVIDIDKGNLPETHQDKAKEIARRIDEYKDAAIQETKKKVLYAVSKHATSGKPLMLDDLTDIISKIQ